MACSTGGCGYHVGSGVGGGYYSGESYVEQERKEARKEIDQRILANGPSNPRIDSLREEYFDEMVKSRRETTLIVQSFIWGAGITATILATSVAVAGAVVFSLAERLIAYQSPSELQEISELFKSFASEYIPTHPGATNREINKYAADQVKCLLYKRDRSDD